ncbi:hypothetical protein [Acinetobacter baumannii]|uniref:hypothetical protein n=1 Tax=Acinetobacter baumannii TaxID=470 RepID=UPI003891901C
MDNYKIKVKDEAESKEAQELFFALGVSRPDGTKNTYHSPTVFGLLVVDGLLNYVFAESVFYDSNAKDLTLPQLRDLVVLKRNDINDATHADEDRRAYLDSEGKYHFYIHAENKWNYSQDVQYVGQYLKPIAQPQDPALISGAEALRALADGKEVVGKAKDYESEWLDASHWTLTAFLEDAVYFKVKPQTIKLELELPKPFEPNVGENYWFIDSTEEKGYRLTRFDNDENDQDVMQFGAWRTEDEIKQVVEQLRKMRGTNS